MWIIVAQRNHGSRSDGDSVGTQRQRLGNIGTGSNAARYDQLHFTVHVEILQRLHRRAYAGQRRLADMFNEDILCRCRSTLHAVKHDDIGPGLDGQRSVKVGAGSATLI